MNNTIKKILFYLSATLLVILNYEIVVPKSIFRSGFIPPLYGIILFVSICLVFCVIYRFLYDRSRIDKWVYIGTLLVALLTNVRFIFLMNPYEKPFEGIRYRDTIWEDHHPESPKIFIISFVVIIILFILKNLIDRKKKRTIN